MSDPVTVAIDPDLAREAEALGFDLGEIAEQAVRARIDKERLAREWHESNKASVDSYRSHVETHGLAGANRGLRASQ